LSTSKRRALVLTGAGISAESGIPTFRGAGGLWRTFDAKALATHDAFDEHPDRVWEWYQERRAGVRAASPNAAHVAVTELGLHTPEFLLVTQNVDDLHARAEHNGTRLPADRIVQIHGDIFVTRCEHCGYARREATLEAERDVARGVPTCPKCSRNLRPGVVWFDEALDPAEVARVERFLRGGPCDLVLIVGTTAVFDYITRWAVRGAGTTGALIEVNPDETAFSSRATATVREPASIAVPRLVSEFLQRAR
jgi:NAD-dependent deacetylase